MTSTHQNREATQTQSWWPILALLLGATLWGLFWLPLRWLEARGMEGIWAALLIYLGTLVVAIPMLWRHAPELRRFPVTMVIIGLASGWCNVSFFLAVLDGTVVRVVLLFYLSPVWSVLLGRLILGEQLNARAWSHWAVGIIGALIMLADPDIGWPLPQSAADWLALTSGMAFSLANVMTRKISAVPVGAKTAVSWTGCVFVAGLWLLVAPVTVPVVSGTLLVMAVGLGMFGMVVMTSCVLYGVSRLPVYQSAVIMLFELVVAAISAQWLTDETVAPREWFGGGLILLAAWLTAHAARDQSGSSMAGVGK